MEESYTAEGIRGYLHTPAEANGDAVVITHGAGSNANAPVVVAVARAFEAAGHVVLRCDLPFRQLRPKGSPNPAGAERDREGLRQAVAEMRRLVHGRVILGGQSYGGRQSTMVAASDAGVADALLLLSYPLHPPGKPQQLRTAHFPELRTPALFVHGTRDPFGSIDEMELALRQVPGVKELLPIEGGGHDLRPALKRVDEVVRRLRALL